MFTPDPCFNEPGYEGIKGTDEGDVSRILRKSSQGSTLYHTLLTANDNSKCVVTHWYSKDMYIPCELQTVLKLFCLCFFPQTLCKEYNATIKLHTIRHAMVGQLREPTPGKFACFLAKPV